MATITSCKFCNKPFHSVGGNICSNCHDQIDQDFFTIRDYLYDNPGAFDIDAICEATGVSKKIALHLLAEKRLTISVAEGTPPVTGGLYCSVCRKPISYGSMCEDCRVSLSNKLGTGNASAATKRPEKIQPDKSGPRMHVHRRDREK